MLVCGLAAKYYRLKAVAMRMASCAVEGLTTATVRRESEREGGRGRGQLMHAWRDGGGEDAGWTLEDGAEN